MYISSVTNHVRRMGDGGGALFEHRPHAEWRKKT